MFLGFVSNFIKNTHFLSYFLPIVGYFEFYFFRLILSPNNLDHIPWRGKGGVFHHSWVSPRTLRPMGILQCHLLWGTRTTESAAGLSHCISPSPLVPRPLLPLCRSQQSLSPCQFCAVPVVTALCSLFPTLILPSVLLFFFCGCGEAMLVSEVWLPPLARSLTSSFLQEDLEKIPLGACPCWEMVGHRARWNFQTKQSTDILPERAECAASAASAGLGNRRWAERNPPLLGLRAKEQCLCWLTSWA